MTAQSNEPELEKKYDCSECGTAVGEDDKVCPKCGGSLEETIISPPQNHHGAVQFLKIFLFALMLLLCYLVCVSAFIILGGKDANMILWMLKTNQLKVEWWREILILYPIPSIIVNATAVYAIYRYLFSKTHSNGHTLGHR